MNKGDKTSWIAQEKQKVKETSELYAKVKAMLPEANDMLSRVGS